MFYAYVIWSEKLGKCYVGSTSEPHKRLAHHNRGISHFTSRGVPWVLRYTEGYSANIEARRREQFLKTGAGRIFINRVLSQAVGYPEAELPPTCLIFERF
jgi:putative endonuclease